MMTAEEEAVRILLTCMGDNPDREGLQETPARVLRSYKELFVGYGQDPANLFKVFTDGACDEMVVLRGVSFSSMCEHHLLPFLGVAHIAYLPSGKIIGVSKLVRLLDVFARRLQIQERLTQEVTEMLDKHLKPKGSACIIECNHLCMSCRGVSKPGSIMVTSSLTGAFKNDSAARHEFLRLVGK